MHGYAQADMLLSAAGLLDAQGEMVLPNEFGGSAVQMSGYIDPALST